MGSVDLRGGGLNLGLESANPPLNLPKTMAQFPPYFYPSSFPLPFSLPFPLNHSPSLPPLPSLPITFPLLSSPPFSSIAK